MITEVEKQDYGMKEEVNPEYLIKRMCNQDLITETKQIS